LWEHQPIQPVFTPATSLVLPLRTFYLYLGKRPPPATAVEAYVGARYGTEDIDNSELGKLISYIRGDASKLEAEKIRERTMRGKKARAIEGFLHHDTKDTNR
jgi:hypothetical protein